MIRMYVYDVNNKYNNMNNEINKIKQFSPHLNIYLSYILIFGETNRK